jgi:hypothetical protein
LAKTVNFFNPVSNLFIQLANNMLNGSAPKNTKNVVEERFKALAKSVVDLSKSSKAAQTGFKVWEVMSGEHEFEDSPAGKLPFEFQIDWGPTSVIDFLNPFGNLFFSNQLKGTVTVGGLCTDVPCAGHLDLNYFTEQKIRYTFEFEVEGIVYEYIGEKKNIYPWNLLYAHTTCFGSLTQKDTQELVSTSITHFYWDTLWTSIKSFELIHR